MTADPLISVVIPTKDRPHVLQRSVASVLRQTYANLELWIVDDGSEPAVELPSDVMSDSRVHLFRNDAPRGPATARNAGVARSKGSLIAFLDDDDEWFPDKLRRQAEMLSSLGPRSAAVDTGYQEQLDGRIVTRYIPLEQRDLSMNLLTHPCLVPSCVLLRRSAFEEVGGFDESFPLMHEDWDLWLRLTDRFDIVPLPEILVSKEAHKGNPHDLMRAWELTIPRLARRAAQLPSAQRRRTAGLHEFMVGVLAAQSGQRRRAAASLFRAWTIYPLSPRPLLHLARLATGERMWARIATTVRSTRDAVRSGSGAEPPIDRW